MIKTVTPYHQDYEMYLSIDDTETSELELQ